jgi:hypothetical protein
MHFGENQLSRSLIGLSPLPTAHPPGFQPWWVRSSTRSYPRFNLAMGRSLRFGSTTCDYDALFRLAFATAAPHGLTSPHIVTRRLILQKARGHITPARDRNAPTACRHTVSGTISRPLTGVLFTFPSRYWFTIGHQGVFRLRGWSPRIHTEFHGLRATWEHAREPPGFRIRGYHPLCQRFPTLSATQTVCNSLPGRQSRRGGPSTPRAQRLPAITRTRFGLFPFRSPLLRESRLLSLPAGTEMFHFPALPPPALCVQAGVTGNYARQVSLFGNPRITAWLPAPRGLSQAPTSFIGSWCQGIHRAPLSTWRLQLMLASTVQFSRYGRPRDKTRRIRSGPSRSNEKTRHTPVPSGPNSVLSRATAAAGVPSPRRETY